MLGRFKYMKECNCGIEVVDYFFKTNLWFTGWSVAFGVWEATRQLPDNPIAKTNSVVYQVNYITDHFCLCSRIYPQASSKEGPHGSQSNNSRYPCAVVFTSPLTGRLCSQLQELQELPTSPLRMWSSSKRASASIYQRSWTGSWAWVQGARSWCSTSELSTHSYITD